MKGNRVFSARVLFCTEWLEQHFHRLSLTILILPFLMAGCVHWPDIATDCEAYGVLETDQPMAYYGRIEPLPADELDRHCASIKEAVAKINPGAQIRGCVIPEPDGMVSAYYSVGDQCARNHELCHVMHGTGHTARYNEKAADNHPRPYCPENQLQLLAGTH